MINITDKTKCVGCTACKNICSKKAINFTSDNQGFSYPVVDMEKCVDCSLCEKVCPILNPVQRENNFNPPIIKAAWNLDDSIRINSTSGGVFSALAKQFIEDGGYVVGAEYTEDFRIKHTIISSENYITKQRQSKYAESDLGIVYCQIKQLLNKGEKVMFCGSPCQGAGLRNFLIKEYDNLFILDYICRGIISQKVYKKYLESVERHSNSKITKVHFKNKDFGWNRFSTKLSLDNGETYHKDRNNDEYMVGYLKYNLYLRPCCNDCQFKTLPRLSDISLGDFWGIANANKNLDNDKGTSVVIINSEKGKNLFDKMDNVLFSEDSTVEQVTKGNACLLNVAEKGKYSDYFYRNIDKDFISLIHHIQDKDLWENKNLSTKERLFLSKKLLIFKLFK